MSFKKNRVIEAALLFCLSAALQADVTVTQLANEGVILSDGNTRIMIDGMVVEPYSVYGGLAGEAAVQFEQAEGVFSAIELALASHRHHDHNQPEFACRFLTRSSMTQFVSSPQVLGLMREKCRPLVAGSPRIREILPAYEQPYIFAQGSAKITVFQLNHGRRKYARIQNFGHLVEMGGLKVLHIGDAAMDETDFARAGLDSVEIDVALIPFWFFQPGPGESVVRQYMDAPHKIAVHIPPGEMAEVSDYLGANFPEVTVLENTLQQASFTATGQPPP